MMPPAVQSFLHQSLPLPVVAALLLQTAGFVWIGSDKFTSIDMRLAVIEKFIEGQSGQNDRIIILEQSLGGIKEDLADIKKMLREQNGGVQ
jgi:hypothetical protein